MSVPALLPASAKKREPYAPGKTVVAASKAAKKDIMKVTWSRVRMKEARKSKARKCVAHVRATLALLSSHSAGSEI